MANKIPQEAAKIVISSPDLYLVAGGRRYVIEQSRRLAESAKVTPVVDGCGLKNTLERETVRWLQACGGLDFRAARCWW